MRTMKTFHRSRPVARYAGQLWHVDINYVTIHGEKVYLIGFIDNRTRFLLYYEFMGSKTSKSCAESLNNALSHVEVRPKLIAIDNGGEFLGESFQNVLKEHGIEQYRTHPYTPQENEKIDRFWLIIERAKPSQEPWSTERIRDIIHQYNYYWSHRSLKMLTGQSTTPYKAWTTMVKYTGQDDACIDVIVVYIFAVVSRTRTSVLGRACFRETTRKGKMNVSHFSSTLQANSVCSLKKWKSASRAHFLLLH